MDDLHFDSLTRRLGQVTPRRPLIAAFAATLFASVYALESASACKKVGKMCDKNKDCCDGARCKGGKKGKCRCKSGLTECGGKCKNLDNDANHCGACNNACAPDAICEAGVCVCGRNDNAFACGTSGGECGPPCADNEACVNGTCVSCVEACPDEGCTLCLRLADGSTRCGGPGTTYNCPEPCTSSADCEGDVFNECVVSTIVKSNGSVSNPGENCLSPVATGLCTSVRSCSSQ